MRAIGYARVSTTEQAASGLSLAAQVTRIKAHAVAQGIDLIDVVIEAGASAKSLVRPELQDVLDRLTAGEAEAIVAVKLDRLTRSVVDLATLIERADRDGFSLVVISEAVDTSTAAGRLVANVLASVGQWEREAIGERTSVALRAAQAAGRHVGRAPFGFVIGDDGVLVPCDREQAVIARMRELRAEGRSFRAVADDLAAEGIETRSGTSWNPGSVCRVVREAA